MAINSPIESQQGANLSLFYGQVSGSEAPGTDTPLRPFYRRVPDLERSVERARALGGRVLLPPSPAPSPPRSDGNPPSDGDPIRIAVVADPEGRALGLAQSGGHSE